MWIYEVVEEAVLTDVVAWLQANTTSNGGNYTVCGEDTPHFNVTSGKYYLIVKREV